MELARLGRALGERRVVGHEREDTDRIVKSAGRVLRILELFDVLKREALVSEVSYLLELPQSSTSVLLRSLVMMGYLSYNSQTRAFVPTTRVALLGSWVNEPLLSDGPLIRLLHRLNVRTGQAVVLAVRNQIWSQYIHVVQATSPVRLFVMKGSRRPLVCSATGLTLLADLPDAEIKRIGNRFNSEPQEGDLKVCLSSLLEKVHGVRANGYAFNYDTVTPGAGAFAMLLPQLGTEEKLSVGVAAPTEVLRKHKDEFVVALHDEIASHVAGQNVEPIVRTEVN